MTPCDRCDNCTGRHWSAEVPEPARSAARERLRRPGVEIAPRKQWPPGMATLGVELSGRLPAAELAATGRAVGRLTDVGWGGRLRELFAAGAGSDGPVPADLLDACVAVLADWDWPARPVGVVSVESRSRPQLVASLAERIATLGRLPLLGSVTGSGAAASTANSAHRAAALVRSLRAPELPPLDGPVLLVDDRIDTGWTVAVAARALRLAGAPAVLPLVLATTT